MRSLRNIYSELLQVFVCIYQSITCLLAVRMNDERSRYYLQDWPDIKYGQKADYLKEPFSNQASTLLGTDSLTPLHQVTDVPPLTRILLGPTAALNLL